MLFVGICLFVCAFLVDTKSYSGVDFDGVILRWSLLSLAGSAIGIAFILFITGWIIHAISFLPGSNDIVTISDRPQLVLEEAMELPVHSSVEAADADAEKRSEFTIFITGLGIILALLMIGLGISYFSKSQEPSISFENPADGISNITGNTITAP
ncbi:hypothetical protein FIV32_02360 [Sphingomonadales bacterium 58]|uniref:hypothetical protein n=1 Tax=Sphingobium sp. S8 TaxID=2758385 RepID=UPI001919B8DC|nr:hypothetical protein [Sphingobium sp. S8]MBY2957592.1 hypothetical protein [Sphingomonadales bacterium 58]